MIIILWILFAILAILQIPDFYTTKRIIDRSGHEEAKIMIWLMDRLGPLKAMVISKALAIKLHTPEAIAFFDMMNKKNEV